MATKTKTEEKALEATGLRAFEGINLRHIRSEVTEALANFGRFGIMEEYTKHDITHIDEMLRIVDWLVPDQGDNGMTAGDWLMTCLSVYFHDFGLLVTRDEFEARADTAFPIFREEVLGRQDANRRNYATHIERMPEIDAERFLYGEFVRQNHAQRIKSWLQPSPTPTLGFDPAMTNRLRSLLADADNTFVEDLALICESHHLDDLGDTKKYAVNKPYGTDIDEAINLQYSAVLLRSADLLHITRDRVPSMSALVVNPRNPVSQAEWGKQARVRSVRPQAPRPPVEGSTGAHKAAEASKVVEVHADVTRAESFFGLTSYITYAQDQLRRSRQWVEDSRSTLGSLHQFPWHSIDDSAVLAKGFVARTFEFSIDQGKILDLLTGHTLYNDTGVVVRELMQNALDAVRLQALLADPGAYTPAISVFWSQADNRLTITDNGTGMSGRIIERNFLKVGASRYQDEDFIKAHPGFTSISRFGIGVLSAFMVADDVTVVTVHEEEKEARHIDLRDVHGKYLVRLLDKSSPEVPDSIREHGTTISLRLRPTATLKNISTLLEKWIVVPGCEVLFSSDSSMDQVQIGYASVAEALKSSLLKSGAARPTTDGLATRFGNDVEVRMEEPSPGISIAYAVEYSPWLQEWNFLAATDQAGIDDDGRVDYGICVSGVRVTSPPAGFVEGGPAVMANAWGPTAPRTNVARSALEVTPEYDALLSSVYGVLTGHVTAEMDSLEQKRQSSSTRASQEATWIVGHLVPDSGIPSSNRLLSESLRTVPAIVVEQSGVRTRESVDQLRSRDVYAMIEGREFLSLESVLRSVRGASKASLGSMLRSLGIDKTFDLPSYALICGLTPRNIFADLFRADWEIASLAVDSEKRNLTASWRQKGASRPSSWHRHHDVNLVPKSFQAIGEQLLRDPYSNARGVDATHLATGHLDLDGISEEIVVFNTSLLAMSRCPLLGIEALDESAVAAATRDWLVRLLISAACGRARPRSSAHPSEEQSKRRLLSEPLRVLAERGLYSQVSQPSVEEAIEASRLDTLDVSRWGSRNDWPGAVTFGDGVY